MALFTTLDENKARLRPGRFKTPTIAGDKLFRQWEYIDATVADSLVTDISALTVTNPKADKQTYTGTFAIGLIKAEAQGDRSVTITQELTLVNALTDIASLRALSPVKLYENEILRPNRLDEGEQDRVTFEYRNINPTSRATAMAFTDAEIEGTLGVATGEYWRRAFNIQEDGTAIFTISSTDADFFNTSGDTPDRVLATTRTFSNDNYDPQNDKAGVNRTKVDGADDVPNDAAYEIADNQVAESGWALTGVSVSENGDGGAAIRRAQVKKRATTDQFVTRFSSAQGNQPESQTVVWLNLSETDADTVYNDATSNQADMTAATPAAPASHVLRHVEKPFETGVDSDGKQMFGVVRITWIPRSSNGTFRGAQDGEIKPFKIYGISIKNNFQTVNPYIVIEDRKVTDVYADARDFADDSDVNPVDQRRLGGVKWDDSIQRYIAIKETWWGTGTLAPDNNYSSITSSTPTR